MTKEELELLLKAFTLMENKEFDERKSIATIRASIEAEYIALIKKELSGKK